MKLERSHTPESNFEQLRYRSRRCREDRVERKANRLEEDAMSASEELYMTCDDTNNVDFGEIDLSSVPPEVLAEVDAIFNGKTEKLAAV